MLMEIKAQTQAAIGDIRRLAYDLRPPALDQLALSAHCRSTPLAQPATTWTYRYVCHDLQPLPAAVEVAAYRIATEALTNVIRHARRATARSGCAWPMPSIWPWTTTASAYRTAIGRRGDGVDVRAPEELGGGCRIERRAEGGTRLIARLPVSDLGASDVPIPVL